MQNLLIVLVAALSLSSSSSSLSTYNSGTLQLKVENIRQKAGTIWVGLYKSSEDFLDRDQATLLAAQVDRTGSIYITLPDLQQGKDYAIALFHDLNDNGELDTNWLGLPSEPWAFSGEPRTRLRLPRFEEVKFRYDRRMNRQQLSLRKW